MDIVIISNFCMDFSLTDKERFFYISKLLVNKFHDVELITSDFFHIKKQHRENMEIVSKVKITFLHETGYSRNICLQRFHSHYVWGKNVVNYLKNRKRPDVVYCAVPSLTGPNLVAKYCEKKGIRFICDIQDLWPEAFQMVFNIPIVKDIVFLPFRILANGIYKRSDAICGVSDTYCKRVINVNRKYISSTVVFLGIDLLEFDRYAELKVDVKKHDIEIWIAYCGTLGASYDLTCVIDAMTKINNSKVKLIVMGDGPRKTEFEKYAIEKNVNAQFVGRIPYDKMCALLKKCDIAVNPISHNAAQSIINKHADYAAAGLPVISTQESLEYRRLVDEYEMGYNCPCNDAVAVAEKIVMLSEDGELRKRLGKNARRCAVEKFDRKNTYPEIIKVIESEV